VSYVLCLFVLRCSFRKLTCEVIGVAILVYDICMTHRAERYLIWRAPKSASKYAFIVHRYLAPISLLYSFVILSGFVGLRFSDKVGRLLSVLVKG
jgi:hypothetical protein